MSFKVGGTTREEESLRQGKTGGGDDGSPLRETIYRRDAELDAGKPE